MISDIISYCKKQPHVKHVAVQTVDKVVLGLLS